MITKYGLDNFFAFLILAFLLIASGSLVRTYWLGFSLVLTGCLLIGFALVFFRDPPRHPPAEVAEDPTAVLAPADGRIVAIHAHSNYPPIGPLPERFGPSNITPDLSSPPSKTKPPAKTSKRPLW